MNYTFLFIVFFSLFTIAETIKGRLTWFEPQAVECEGQSFNKRTDMVVAMVNSFSKKLLISRMDFNIKGVVVNASRFPTREKL